MIELFNGMKKLKSVVLSTIGPEGEPKSRAMLVIEKGWSVKGIYFSTNTSSRKVSEIKNNSRSSIYYMDEKKFLGVNIVGESYLIDDQEKKDYFFEEGDEQYYPLGSTDPDYIIVKFVPKKIIVYSKGESKEYNLNAV